MGFYFFVWKFKPVAAVFGVLLATLVVCGALAGWRELDFQAQAVGLRGKVIVLDAGHGGIDSGAVGYGVIEKEVVLNITHYLAGELQKAGAKVIFTRVGDAPPTSGAFSSARDQKKRVEIANASAADCLLSIHANAFPSARYYGAQVFVDRSAAPRSLQLARSIQEALRQTTETDRQVNAGITHYLLRYSSLPAVTVEVGFLSNPREARLLAQPDYQRRVAYSIFQGIVSYFSQNN